MAFLRELKSAIDGAMNSFFSIHTPEKDAGSLKVRRVDPSIFSPGHKRVILEFNPGDDDLDCLRLDNISPEIGIREGKRATVLLRRDIVSQFLHEKVSGPDSGLEFGTQIAVMPFGSVRPPQELLDQVFENNFGALQSPRAFERLLKRPTV